MSSEEVTTRDTEARGRLLAVWPLKSVFVVEEILKTEQDYVMALKQIIEGYLKPLHSHLFEHAERPISIAAVFGNITQLHEFNTMLWEELTSSQDDPMAFGQVFVKNKDSFMQYSEYCTNYKSAVRYLQRLIHNNPLLGSFLAQCQKNLHHSFSLHDRLLKPVQRILKYHLLLENLLHGISPDHCGYASISEARMTMSEVADHINKVVKVQEVYSALNNDETTVPLKKMTSDRELIHEGVCKVGRSREIELVLFQKLLLFFKKEVDGSYTYEDHILAGELHIEEDPRNQKCFMISSTKKPTKKYSLQVQMPEDRQVWLDKIGQMETHSWQDTVALERKKTVQNLSRLKLQASRRQPVQTSRHNRLVVRMSSPAHCCSEGLPDIEQPQERSLSTVENNKLQRTKAVRLRKGLSTDSDSPISWLTSPQWRSSSGSIITPASPTNHVIQTSMADHDDGSNGDTSPPANSLQVSIAVTIHVTKEQDDIEKPHPQDDVERPHPPKDQDDVERPHPPKDQDDVERPHPPEGGSCPPSPEIRLCPVPPVERPHLLLSGDNAVVPCDHRDRSAPPVERPHLLHSGDDAVVRDNLPLCKAGNGGKRRTNALKRTNVTPSSRMDPLTSQQAVPSPHHDPSLEGTAYCKLPNAASHVLPTEGHLSDTTPQCTIKYDCDSPDDQKCLLPNHHPAFKTAS